MATDCSALDKIRSHRTYGLSVFDWSTALLGGLLIGRYILDLSSVIHWILWIILWFIIGIVVHVIVKVPTMLGFYIGLNEKPQEKSC